MAQQRRYDISRYVSLPLALGVVIVIFLALIFLGLKYSILTGDVLATKAIGPSVGLNKCAQEQANCIRQKNKAYDTCTVQKQQEYRQCVAKTKTIVNRKKRDEAVVKCELAFGKAADMCLTNACAADGVLQCASVKECVQKIYDKKKAPAPAPKPAPGPPKKDPVPDPKPAPPADPGATDVPITTTAPPPGSTTQPAPASTGEILRETSAPVDFL